MPKLKFKKHVLAPDTVYGSVMVARFINKVMQKGKKATARKIVYDAFALVQKELKKEPIEIFEKAIENVAPLLAVKSKRVGGATYQVPVEVKGDRRVGLAMRWILESSRKGKGKPMAQKLAQELLNAYKNEGSAVKKREETHRMAEANRAFAHFAW
ncbi:MAG: small subunit ribosomal protein S7 [Parcubacteria group bacterium Greene0416_39]|nr:MAG: small subunit ribosomal protein S7 [Parcubacteria group bacterium Greene0416_39]TSC97690.1 MAG: small subunit ribosomal protein S7 [Parcubacteria group bacterium Greene1014_47]